MKSRYRNNLRALECLESRLTPASTVVLGDLNGDQVKFTSSLGTLAGLITSTPAPDGVHDVFSVDISASTFNGTNFSVSVTKSETGDGQAIVGYINAGINNLGTVKVAADLGDINAGNLSPTIPAIKTLSVNSFGPSANLALATTAPPATVMSARWWSSTTSKVPTFTLRSI